MNFSRVLSSSASSSAMRPALASMKCSGSIFCSGAGPGCAEALKFKITDMAVPAMMILDNVFITDNLKTAI